MNKYYIFGGLIISTQPLVIIGAGDFGREVAWLISDINKMKSKWNLLGFLDDDKTSTPEGYPVLGNIMHLFDMEEEPWVIVALRDSKVRKNIIDNLIKKDVKLATLTHPTAKMSAYVKIGIGSIVCAGSIITTNVSIGKGSIININGTIGHDVVLDDYVSLMPAVNLAGNVCVGEGACLGQAANVINGLSIGTWSCIGAGAVVVDDIPDRVLAVGVPAKIIKKF